MLKRCIISVLAALLLLAASPAGIPAGEIDHSGYDAFLKKFTRNGTVGYRAVKEDGSMLAQYLELLESVDEKDFEQWTREARMAFWINAYNAITIHGIVINYPIEYGGLASRIRFPRSSIRQIENFWDTAFIKVMGKEITLNEIEHEILRKEFGDPRIHFSIVCASIGCPVLSADAYRAETLEKQLDDDAKRLVNDREKIRFNKKRNVIYVSSIFKWYREDFSYNELPEWLREYKKKNRGFMQFIVDYIDEEWGGYITANTPKVKFLDYDWSLNDLTAEDM